MTGFDAKDYRFWFERLTTRLGDALRIGWVGGALVAGLLPCLLALTLVAPFGRAGLFVRTPAVGIGWAGVTLVLLASTRAVQILAVALSELERVTIEPARFRTYVDRSFRRAATWSTSVPWIAGFGAGALVLVVAALVRWHQTGVVREDGFQAFPPGWRDGTLALVAAALVLLTFAVAVVLTLAMSSELLIRNLRFAWGLQRFRYMPLPGRVRLALRPLINVYAWTSATWSVGVALFCVFFFGHWSRPSLALVVALAAIGMATFLVPHWSFRRLLDASHDDMSALLCRAVEQGSRRGALKMESVPAVTAANRAVAGDPPPVLTRRGAIAYGCVQIAAFAAVVTRDVLKERVLSLADVPVRPLERGDSSRRPPSDEAHR